MTVESPTRNRWSIVVTAGLGVFMAQLDATIVNVALPEIADRFSVGTAVVQWVMLGYTLPLIALVLPIGRWIDGVGVRTALLWAVGGFSLAGVAASAAPAIELLIAARVIQGTFGAALFVLLPVLAATAVDASARGRAMGVVMTLGPLGGFSGPVIGGILIEHGGASSIFLVNPIIGIVVAGAAAVLLPRDAGLALPARDRVAEAVLLLVAAASVLLSLTFAAESHPGWLLLGLVAVPIVMVWRRRPYSRPVTELLRRAPVTGQLVALSTQMAALLAVQFLAPFILTGYLSATPATTGLTMLAIPAGMIVLGPVGGFLSDHWGAGQTVICGIVLAAVGYVSLLWISVEWTPFDLGWRLAIVGLAAGLFAGANSAMALGGAPREMLATTSAAISMARQIGIATGPAMASMAWNLAGAGEAGMRTAVVIALAATGVCLWGAIWSMSRRSSTGQEP